MSIVQLRGFRKLIRIAAHLHVVVTTHREASRIVPVELLGAAEALQEVIDPVQDSARGVALVRAT